VKFALAALDESGRKCSSTALQACTGRDDGTGAFGAMGWKPGEAAEMIGKRRRWRILRMYIWRAFRVFGIVPGVAFMFRLVRASCAVRLSPAGVVLLPSLTVVSGGPLVGAVQRNYRRSPERRHSFSSAGRNLESRFECAARKAPYYFGLTTSCGNGEPIGLGVKPRPSVFISYLASRGAMRDLRSAECHCSVNILRQLSDLFTPTFQRLFHQA